MTGSVTTDVLIVGGGLSGLRLADLLHQSGRSFHLIEARNRFGGRMLSENGFDLGPAWFWPGQPRMADLVARFDLPVFEQYSTGDFRFEDAQGRIQQGAGAGSMQGSLRIADGMDTLTDALIQALPRDQTRTNARVVAMTRDASGIEVETHTRLKIRAQQVVCALPPRLVTEISFSPALPGATVDILRAVPTWMAGQAKAVAIYGSPFWRAAGLSGDAMSHRGPMVELHDASPADGSNGAIFGFIGVPPQHRGNRDALEQAARAQLMRLFGPEAATPEQLLLKDWAFDNATATPTDQAPLTAHPRYGLPAAAETLWDGALLMSGSETALDFGGYLEGALEAAQRTFATLAPTQMSTTSA